MISSCDLRKRRRRRPQLPDTGPSPCSPKTAKNRRPTYWEKVIKPNLDLIKGWCRRGYTEESIAAQLGMCYPTWWAAKKDHPELVEAVKEGRRDSVILVENALFREATGYQVQEVKKTIVGKDSRGNEIVSETVVTTKHVRPNTNSQIFYLTNRNPERWKHQNRMRVEGGPTPIKMEHGQHHGIDPGKMDQDKLDQLELLLREAVLENDGDSTENNQ